MYVLLLLSVLFLSFLSVYTTAVKIFEPNVSASIVCDETLEHTTTAVKFENTSPYSQSLS